MMKDCTTTRSRTPRSGHRHRGRRRRRGYVLVMTLILLAIAASIASTLGVKSLRKALDASQAQQQLQLRWAMRSCQQAILDRAEKMLEKAEQENEATLAAPSQVHHELQLGDLKLQLLVGDEHAKLNVNALLEKVDGQEGTVASAEQTVRRLMPWIAAPLKLDIRPAAPEGQPRTDMPIHVHSDPASPAKVASFGQVFASPSAPLLLASSTPLAQDAVAHQLTCWGDGRLNLRRASRAALEELCMTTLTYQQVNQILLLRSTRESGGNGSASDMSLGRVLDQLQLTDDKRQAVERQLTDRSSCHSLWITAQGKNRAWHELMVRQTSDSQEQRKQTKVYRFVW